DGDRDSARAPGRAPATRAGTSISAFRAPCGPSDGALHQQLLDVVDRLRRIEVLRAGIDAVHDGVAAKQPVRILEVVEALAGGLVARVGDEAVGLQETRRPDELVRVPPPRGAGGRAAGAEDALVEAVEVLALLGRLQPLAFGRRIIVDD